MILINFEDTKILDLDPEFFVSWLDVVCRRHDNVLGDVSLIFCSDKYLLDMNCKHLNHDYYTDIITFDYTTEEAVSGDLFISIDRVLENASDLSVDFRTELNRVVVHGVLHLLGFGDKHPEEAKRMRKLEDQALLLIVPRET